MENKDVKVYFAGSFSDAAYYLRTVPDLSITAGCTGIMYNKNPTFLAFPDSLLSVRKVEESRTISRNERFIEFGSAVTLSQIEQLGAKRMPQVLYDAVCTIANPQVRNMATLGGNICTTSMKMTAFAPLLALNAQLIFRTGLERAHIPAEKRRAQAETEVVNISQFTNVPRGYFLAKVRIPLEEWQVAVFRRVGPKHEITELSASFVFLANIQKDVLLDLRLAYCGVFSFRSRELENVLIGSKLPLAPKAVQGFCEQAEEFFDAYTRAAEIHYNPVLKAQFQNLLADVLERL